MNISIEELQKIKNKIFDENVSSEEKKNIEDKINEEVNKMLEEIESENIPIDE